MDPTRAPLDGPLWSVLTTPYGDARHAPSLIRELFARRSLSFDAPHGTWAALRDCIYHQQSLYGATYAALPYLAELGPLLDESDQTELLENLAYVAAGRRIDAEMATFGLIAGFEGALRPLARLTVQRLAAGPLSVESASVLAFGLLALIGHPAGALVNANLFPASGLEVECRCRRCQRDYLVSLYPDGVARYVDTFPRRPDVLERDWPACAGAGTGWLDGGVLADRMSARVRQLDAHSIESEVSADLLRAAAVTLARGVDRALEPAAATTLVAASVALHGHTSHARALHRLSGDVRCPHCDNQAPLLSELHPYGSGGA